MSLHTLLMADDRVPRCSVYYLSKQTVAVATVAAAADTEAEVVAAGTEAEVVAVGTEAAAAAATRPATPAPEPASKKQQIRTMHACIKHK
jgi:hypothetical protein